MGKRYIKLYEQIVNWEWFHHPNTLALFIYLLLKANYCDLEYHGRMIRRGQLVTSLPKLSTGTGLTIRQTRTALAHLISTGEVTDESTNQDRIITVVKYDDYQNATDGLTGKRQANDRRVDRQTTDETTPSKEYIERVEEERKDKKKTPSVFVPPTIEEVTDYCRERGNRVDPEKWFDFYASKGWMIGKNKMKDWKAAVRTWEKDVVGKYPKVATTAPASVAQKYEQRDYASEQNAAVDRMMNSDWGSW